VETTEELTITVKVDTEAARREIAGLREYALATLQEILERYAAAGLMPGETGARRV